MLLIITVSQILIELKIEAPVNCFAGIEIQNCAMISLRTKRLIFREWQEEDYPQFSAFYEVKENARFVGGVKTAEESWRLMATYLGHYRLKGYSYLAVETIAEQALIGTIGLWNSASWPEPELGYWLLPEAQGKGYASEAGLAVVQYARQIKLPSLVSYIDPANEPSKKLAQRLGGRYEQTIPLLDFGDHEVYRYW